MSDDPMLDRLLASHRTAVGAASSADPADAGQARARTFLCKQALWETFVKLAEDAGASIDELLDEAMVGYARSRGALDPEAGPRRDAAEPRRGPHAGARGAGLDPEALGAFSARAVMTSAPPLPSRAQHATAPPPPSMRPPPPLPSASRSPPLAGAPRAPRTPGAPVAGWSQPARSATPAAATLTVTYQGRSYVVEKDTYVLGRSKSGADLRLDDPNVSRQHAIIERVGGAYYVVDLGSTNGVFVGGERVARRQLRDGDIIEITTHTIRCTLA